MIRYTHSIHPLSFVIDSQSRRPAIPQGCKPYPKTCIQAGSSVENAPSSLQALRLLILTPIHQAVHKN
ncbi:hypothetical protein D3C80_1699850 [compost metagenome]